MAKATNQFGSMIVYLDSDDLAFAREFARAREDANRRAGTYREPEFRGDPDQEFRSVCGELAFEAATGLKMDRSIRVRRGGADFVRRGPDRLYTIDVKTPRRYGADLTVEYGKRLAPCDIYALVVPMGEDVFEIAGFASKAMVFEKDINGDYVREDYPTDYITGERIEGRKPFFRVRRADVVPFDWGKRGQ